MLFRTCMAVAISVFAVSTATAQQPATSAVLFEDVRIFDGTSEALSGPSHVLVVGNVIKQISASAITPDEDVETTVIKGGGRTLMPGLIDGHTHLMMSNVPQLALLTADIGYVNIVAAKAAGEMLLRGFTSVRDMGGPVLGLKRAIDSGVTPGPRIWPSGAMISQSGGHGDFRLPTDLPAAPDAFSYSERIGAAEIADSPDMVRKRSREQLALGASQIKVMAGGGSSSNYDPIDVTEYTVPELEAAVGAAENWGTYVAVHAYTPRAIRQALEAGVRSIEHGQLVDEDTARQMAEAGVWWSIQPFTVDDATAFAVGSSNWLKQQEVRHGTDTAYGFAKRFGVKTAWGTDILFDPAKAAEQGSFLAKMTRWYTPAEALRMATADNAELLALSGLRSPYQGKLGVVEEGALADLILVDGNPLETLGLVADPAANFDVIMKGGRIYKNAVSN
ncbi:MAG: amidohydrolase family protein [Bauldia litoralis]